MYWSQVVGILLFICGIPESGRVSSLFMGLMWLETPLTIVTISCWLDVMRPKTRYKCGISGNSSKSKPSPGPQSRIKTRWLMFILVDSVQKITTRLWQVLAELMKWNSSTDNLKVISSRKVSGCTDWRMVCFRLIIVGTRMKFALQHQRRDSTFMNTKNSDLPLNSFV